LEAVAGVSAKANGNTKVEQKNRAQYRMRSSINLKLVERWKGFAVYSLQLAAEGSPITQLPDFSITQSSSLDSDHRLRG
jgi:hypothetical protein